MFYKVLKYFYENITQIYLLNAKNVIKKILLKKFQNF